MYEHAKHAQYLLNVVSSSAYVCWSVLRTANSADCDNKICIDSHLSDREWRTTFYIVCLYLANLNEAKVYMAKKRHLMPLTYKEKRDRAPNRILEKWNAKIIAKQEAIRKSFKLIGRLRAKLKTVNVEREVTSTATAENNSQSLIDASGASVIDPDFAGQRRYSETVSVQRYTKKINSSSLFFNLIIVFLGL